MMATHENKIREDFRRKQEAEEQKLCEEQNRRKILLDEVLAKELQVEEEREHMRQVSGIIEEVGSRKNSDRWKRRNNWWKNLRKCRNSCLKT